MTTPRPGSLASRLGGTGDEVVLVVEDERDVAGFLGAFFRASGTEVVHIDPRAAPEVVEAAVAGNVACLLVDLSLDGFSGFEVLTALAADDRVSAIPVLIVSGDNRAGSQERAASLGASGFVTKPFNVKDLFATVQAYVESYRAGARAAAGAEAAGGSVAEAAGAGTGASGGHREASGAGAGAPGRRRGASGASGPTAGNRSVTGRRATPAAGGGPDEPGTGPAMGALVSAEAVHCRLAAALGSYLPTSFALVHFSGTPASPLVVSEVARRLTAALPAGEILGTTAADELAVLFATSGPEEAASALGRAIGAGHLDIDLGPGRTVSITTRAGLAASPLHATTGDELYMAADIALAEARAAGAALVTAR